MLTTAPLLETSFPDLPLHGRGKVRDIYRVGDDLLIVATDRISAFDYVLGSGIPDKGKVLTQLSAFWFERMGDLVPHHRDRDRSGAVPCARSRHTRRSCADASMLCRRTRPVPIECVARGYLSGSGWKEYQQTGSVCGVDAAAGLARIRSAAGADLHAGDESRERPRHQHQRSRGRPHRRRRSGRAVEAADARDLPARRRPRRDARHHRRRHQVRVRPGRRRRSRPPTSC